MRRCIRLVFPSRALTIVPKSCPRQNFTALKKATGFEYNIALSYRRVRLLSFHHPCWDLCSDQESDFELALKYVQELQRCWPPIENNDILDPKEHVEKLTLEMDELSGKKAEHVVKSEADNGNPD